MYIDFANIFCVFQHLIWQQINFELWFWKFNFENVIKKALFTNCLRSSSQYVYMWTSTFTALYSMKTKLWYRVFDGCIGHANRHTLYFIGGSTRCCIWYTHRESITFASCSMDGKFPFRHSLFINTHQRQNAFVKSSEFDMQTLLASLGSWRI